LKIKTLDEIKREKEKSTEPIKIPKDGEQPKKIIKEPKADIKIKTLDEIKAEKEEKLKKESEIASIAKNTVQVAEPDDTDKSVKSQCKQFQIP
jgi:hypothetical protein